MTVSLQYKCTAFICIFFLSCFGLRVVASAAAVISEIMWVGSDLSTADEWIEIVGTAQSGVTLTDLSGWNIVSIAPDSVEKSLYQFATGTLIGSGQYIVISNYTEPASRLSRQPDIVTTSIVLPNTKLLLELRNSSGQTVDRVDDGVGEPFAGGKNTASGVYRSMERISLSASGSLKTNWRSATTFIWFDDGAPLFGTPGVQNNSGYSTDTFAPHEATELSGSLESGTLLLSWIPSRSFDIASQDLFILPLSSTGFSIGLEATTDTFSMTGARIASGATVTLSSIDKSGNMSSGISLILHPSLQSPVSNPQSPVPNLTPSIQITEILPNPIGKDDNEWIEIANMSTGSLSIAGFMLTDDSIVYTIPTLRTLTGAFPPKISTGFILAPFEHVSFRKSVTGISLQNNGETISVFSGAIILDQMTYYETAEEVSVGLSRTGASTLQSYCVPTEGMQNENLPLLPQIEIQSTNGTQVSSGSVIGTGSLSVNLIASVGSGSLASALCSWQYSDGFTSESCNPPSHSFVQQGSGTITMNVQTFCGTTVQQVLNIYVYEKVKNADSSPQYNAPKPSDTTEEILCIPSIFSGIEISEIYPNPFGNETDGEWIELYNTSSESVNLCGWSLDDAEKGSKPYALDEERIAAHSFLVLPRFQTKIAINNTNEQVRLFAPAGLHGEKELVQDVAITKSIEGQSYAKRSDGYFVWTPYVTPEKQNVFKTAERRFPQDTVLATAALPNPNGKDANAEWIEISNVTESPFDLSGWMLDNKPGGSAPYVLEGIVLQPQETKRLSIEQTGIALVNSADSVRLLDPDGYVTSIFGWEDAEEGHIYRLPRITSQRASAKVTRVVDGDTIDIVLTNPDQLDLLPPSLKRRWLSVTQKDNPSIRVRLIGIDTPETVHPKKQVEYFGAQASNFTRALLEGKNIEIEFDQEIWDKYDRLLAYVYAPNGEMVQSLLLRNGYAFAYTRFPFVRKDQFLAYQSEARNSLLGLWADPEVLDYVQEQFDEELEEKIIDEQGLTLSVSPSGGLVATGTTVIFTSSIHADIFVSLESGAYTLLSGSLVVLHDTTVRAFAERMWSGSLIQSNTVEANYIVKRASYAHSIEISEVYPSPKTGETEWIELYNSSDVDINIAGWSIDDSLDSGSKPWVIDMSLIVPASGYSVLTKEMTGISLNNNGDSVVLSSPDGALQSQIAFGSVKKGKSVSIQDFASCLSDMPTSGFQNICIQFATGKNIQDTDFDFIPDDQEMFLYKTDSYNPDSDGDSLLDGFEIFAKTDPFIFTKPSRDFSLLYKKFIQEKINISSKLYKKKGLVIRGKGFPLSSLEIGLDEKKFPAKVQSDFSWEVLVPPPLSSGSYIVDLHGIDLVGTEVFLQDAIVVELENNYTVKPVSTSKKTTKNAGGSSVLPVWARFKNRFIPTYFSGNQSDIFEIPSVLASLLSQSFSELQATNSQKANVPDIATAGAYVLSGCILCIKKLYNR